MRKAVLLVVLIMLASMVSVVRATPIEELTSLAEYFPGDTLAYATIRTDDGYFETIDSVAELINDNLGGEILPEGVTSAALLDAALMDNMGLSLADFEWVGDAAAVGVPNLDAQALMMGDMDELPFLIATEISDAEAATAFIGGSIGSDVTQTEADNYTLFSDGTVSLLIAEDVMLIGVDVDAEVAFQRDGTLAASEGFQTTIGAMPNPEYNIFAYLDLNGLTQLGNDLTELALQMAGGDEALGGFGLTELLLTSSEQDLGQLAMGFTLLDSRTATIDFISTATQTGMIPMVELPPVDMAFAGNVPAEAELVIHGTNYGGSILGQFAALDTIMPQVQMFIDAALDAAAPEGEELPEDIEFILRDLIGQSGLGFFIQPEDVVQFARDIDLSIIQIGGIVESQITPLFAGFTGLNLRDDVLDWMTSDYAMWISLYPVESDLDFTVDMGYATVATAPDEAAYIVERLTEAITLYGLGHFVEEIGGGDALVVTAPVRVITAAMLGNSPEVAEILAGTPELDLIFGANDDIFTFSSRPGAELALTGEGESLLDDPAFTYAAENLFLENANSVWWVNTAPLADAVLEILPALEATMGSMDGADQAVIALANVVESATITTSMDGDIGLARLTVTVPAEPYGEFDMDALMGGGMAIAEPPMGDVFVNIMTANRYTDIPQGFTIDGIPTLGQPEAPVTVQLVESFSCPPCANFEDQFMGDLIDLAASGDILIEFYPFRIFETDEIAGVAAQCAAAQDLFWQAHDVIFMLQRTAGAEMGFTAGNIQSSLSSMDGIMLDEAAFESCIATGDPSLLNTGTQLATDLGVTGTPTVFINGERISNATLVIDELNALIGN